MTDSRSTDGGEAPIKVDPETLVLRGSPVRVARFRRGMIIAIAGAGSTAIMAIAWLALKPTTLGLLPSEEDGRQVALNAPPDALAGAPRSYGEVPQLGPPLPGDLGRPILEHQRQTEFAGTGPMSDEGRRSAQRAEAERERVDAERRAARESGILVQLGGVSRASEGSAIPAAIGAAGTAVTQEVTTETGRLALDRQRDPNAQQRKLDFVGTQGKSGGINPYELTPPASPYMLSAGSIIAASLITGLNSDLPGMVTAQVTEGAYDSVTGRILLIPQGARLIGSYDSVVAFGQSRALVVWQRIILPDGSSIRIDNLPATDTSGYAGLSDQIDRHTWQLLKGVALSTVLGVGTELSFGDSESDLVRAIRESAQQNGARAGDQLISRNLDIQPTLRVRPGWPLRVIVHKDIILRPWRNSGS